MAENRGEDRSDAGRPAEGEGQSHHISAEEAERLLHLRALFTIEQADLEEAEKVQPHRDDDHAREIGQKLQVLAQRLAKEARRRAERREDGAKAQDEEDGGKEDVAARAGAAFRREILHRHAGEEREIRGHERQDARRQEG